MEGHPGVMKALIGATGTLAGAAMAWPEATTMLCSPWTEITFEAWEARCQWRLSPEPLNLKKRIPFGAKKKIIGGKQVNFHSSALPTKTF
jgi:hypothetical protein